jgi:hypothetical protein
MITEIKMFGCDCDNCGEVWEDWHSGYIALIDKDSIANRVAEDDEWYSDGNTHYCPKCFKIDDEDNLIITPREKFLTNNHNKLKGV